MPRSKTLVMDTHPDDWVAKADDDVLACRGQRHNFPKLRVGKNQRRGVKTHPRDRDGAYVITMTCQDCGLVERTMTITPGGVTLEDVGYGYNYDDRYKAPKGTRVSSRACRAETVRRVLELLEA